MNKELQQAYEEYIELLGNELDATVQIAHTTGWRSDNFEKGIELREKIAKLKAEQQKQFEELNYNPFKIGRKVLEDTGYNLLITEMYTYGQIGVRVKNKDGEEVARHWAMLLSNTLLKREDINGNSPF